MSQVENWPVVDTAKAALTDEAETTLNLLRSGVGPQTSLHLRPPAAPQAFEQVRVVQESIEQCGAVGHILSWRSTAVLVSAQVRKLPY